MTIRSRWSTCKTRNAFMKKIKKKSTVSRSERVGDMIYREIGTLMVQQVSDPRLKGCTVVSINMSPDLRVAKIYFSILKNTDQKVKEAFAGFAAASGFFKKHLAKTLSLRFTPELRFFLDSSLEQGAHILSLLKEVEIVSDEPDDDDPGDSQGD